MLGNRITACSGAAILAAGLALAAPATASAQDDPCILGWSNVGPRSCAGDSFTASPATFAGDGLCIGRIQLSGTSYDGPVQAYSSIDRTRHGISAMISAGVSPLGEWGSTVLNCDTTAIVDWHNTGTGRSGTVTVPVSRNDTSISPVQDIHLDTGPGQVNLTVRTDRPTLPGYGSVFVP